MTFKHEDLIQYQKTAAIFFAIIPRKTITGWAWLTDLKKIQTTILEPAIERGRSFHFEKLWDHRR